MRRIVMVALLMAGVLSADERASAKTISNVQKTTKNRAHRELKNLYQKAYGGKKKDFAQSAIALKDGGYIIAGASKSWGHGNLDMLVVRFDKEGKPQMRATFGGEEDDQAHAVVATADGNFMAIGTSESFSKDGDKDLFVVKFDKDCKRIWQKHFGGKRDEEGFAAVATPNGGALIAGTTESYGRGYKDGYVLFIDKNGKKIFEKAIGGKGDDLLYGIALSSKGGFFVAGESESFGKGGFDFYLVKFDSHGKYLYKRVLGGEEDDAFLSLAPTKDGGCVAAGYTESFESKHKDIDVMRFDAKGKMVWHKIFGFKSKEWANSVMQMKNGGFLVAGTTNSFGFGSYDFYLLELNEKGSSVWANVYGDEKKDIAHSIIGLADGTYLLSGETKSYGQGNADLMYIKLGR